jgi:hypothetical protein
VKKKKKVRRWATPEHELLWLRRTQVRMMLEENVSKEEMQRLTTTKVDQTSLMGLAEFFARFGISNPHDRDLLRQAGIIKWGTDENHLRYQIPDFDLLAAWVAHKRLTGSFPENLPFQTAPFPTKPRKPELANARIGKVHPQAEKRSRSEKTPGIRSRSRG